MTLLAHTSSLAAVSLVTLALAGAIAFSIINIARAL